MHIYNCRICMCIELFGVNSYTRKKILWEETNNREGISHRALHMF